MLERMRKMIAEQLNVNAADITMETSFKEDLGADSLDLYELIMALEEAYDIEVPSEEFENMKTVGSVIQYLKSIDVEE